MGIIGSIDMQPMRLPVLAFIDRITATADGKHAEVTLRFHAKETDWADAETESMTICMRDAAAAVAYARAINDVARGRNTMSEHEPVAPAEIDAPEMEGV